MHQEEIYLSDFYADQTIISILDFCINQRYAINFFNPLTELLQPLTMVQLSGLIKFRGINILLETGQTYQIGLEVTQPGTYQEVFLLI